MSAASLGFNEAELAKAVASLELLQTSTLVGAKIAADLIGREIVTEIRRLIGSGGGPSAPGQPPARRTGILYRSYAHKQERNGPDSIMIEVGSDAEYAPYLEFGTSKMAPRPHLRPAVENYTARGQSLATTVAAITGAQQTALGAARSL